MSDRLTDEDLDRLEELHLHVGDGRVVPPRVYDFDPYSSSEVQRAFDLSAHACIPALLAEVREHRAREAAHRAALDKLVDGAGR